MKIPVGFSERDVSDEEVRLAQAGFLAGRALMASERAVIDAILSWHCRIKHKDDPSRV